MSRTGIVDMHAHYFAPAYLDLMAEFGPRCGARYVATPEGPVIHVAGEIPSGPVTHEFVDLPARIAAMDRQRVQWQALSLTQPMVYFDDAEFSRALARAYNDALADAHRRYPERLVGLATLPLTHPAAALEELERVAVLPGIRGLYFGTNTGRQELSDRSLFPLYERIEALGLPIFLHPVRQVGFERLRPFFLRNLLGNPMENALAAAHLIFGGVLDTFPGLEVSLPHAGGALPFLAGRLDRGHGYHPDCRHLPHPPSWYLQRFTYDTIGHSPRVLQFLIDTVGVERVMLGSDYCFRMGYERPVEVVEALPGLTDAQRDLILGANARRVLRL